MLKKPNILLIMLDQLRYDCLGYAGAVTVHTPNIDRLVAGGAWMDRAYTLSPACCTAKQAIMRTYCACSPLYGGTDTYPPSRDAPYIL